MIDEKNLIRDNIKKFRQPINEGADRSKIAQAIEDREIIQIYYAGDDTVRRGYRTIEPHVLGFIKKNDGQGDLALRAWQQAGASDTFTLPPKGRWARNPRRKDHEYFNDYPNNKEQAGWRLFKVKDITYMLPTGRKFPAKNNSELRPHYNPNDKDLNVITAFIPSSDIGSQEISGSQSGEVSDVTKQKLSAFDAQSPKWKINADEEKGDLIRNVVALELKIRKLNKDAVKYYDLVKRNGVYDAVKKNSRARFNYKPEEVIGDLKTIFDKFTQNDFEDTQFFNKQITKGQIADKNIEKRKVVDNTV